MQFRKGGVVSFHWPIFQGTGGLRYATVTETCQSTLGESVLNVCTLDASLVFQHVVVHLADDLILRGRAAESIYKLAIGIHQVEAANRN